MYFKEIFPAWARRKQRNLVADVLYHLHLSIRMMSTGNPPCLCSQNRGGYVVEAGYNTTLFNCVGISNVVSLDSSIVAGEDESSLPQRSAGQVITRRRRLFAVDVP